MSGILDQPPEEFEYVDYRPQLNQSLQALGGIAAAALVKSKIFKGFGKSGKQKVSSKAPQMNPQKSVNLNKRPGKGGVSKRQKPQDLPPPYSEEALPAYAPKKPPRNRSGTAVKKEPPPLPPRKMKQAPPPSYQEATRNPPPLPPRFNPVAAAKQQIQAGRAKMAAATNNGALIAAAAKLPKPPSVSNRADRALIKAAAKLPKPPSGGDIARKTRKMIRLGRQPQKDLLFALD